MDRTGCKIEARRIDTGTTSSCRPIGADEPDRLACGNRKRESIDRDAAIGVGKSKIAKVNHPSLSHATSPPATATMSANISGSLSVVRNGVSVWKSPSKPRQRMACAT